MGTNPVPNLALIRTQLANERTILAYLRTAIMLAGTGVSLVKLLEVTPDLIRLGWLLIALGAVVMVIGTYRYLRLRHKLNGQVNCLSEPESS
ncbi:DUF202 domain-containing protein [Roseiconus lacunae]|uniref:DUF202 domain-containing protein n=1 Tax=Roseiconus lacunae TaxID=2605694 RepID=UPI001E3C9E08|nr:DUF202 domain-containing protein [Roseiconus lacunae]MCD0461773.1 DUF202 domain-containing protein [Roseiconus lacunae]